MLQPRSPGLLRVPLQCPSPLSPSHFPAQFPNTLADSKQTPFTLSFPDLFRFTILNVLVCPPNFLWQIWLERTFPAYIDVKPSRFVEMEKGEGVLSPTVRKPKFHWFNTVKKWVLDCFTLGAIANTLAFLVVMGALKGKPVVVIVEAIKKVGSREDRSVHGSLADQDRIHSLS